MKKISYALIGFILVSIMLSVPIASAQGTTYYCTGVVDAEATWKVKTVNNGTLEAIFGPTWVTTIENSFGTGASVVGAKMKTKVTYVNSSYIFDPTTVPPYLVMAPVDACIILADVWWWTTSPFGDTPDLYSSATIIFMHPENLTTYCQILGATYTVYEGNVSERNAFPYLNGLPYNPEDYLSELLWDNDYVIQGTTVTHTITGFYIGFFGVYGIDCTETWRYSSSYGTFLGYKLVHNNGTVAYETALVTPSAEEIPGFELLVLTATSIGTIICVIYVIMKKK
ncbi:MAG: hypothetical protein ACFFAQ_13485 [Promethearchaeota archaeon]